MKAFKTKDDSFALEVEKLKKSGPKSLRESVRERICEGEKREKQTNTSCSIDAMDSKDVPATLVMIKPERPLGELPPAQALPVLMTFNQLQSAASPVAMCYDTKLRPCLLWYKIVRSCSKAKRAAEVADFVHPTFPYEGSFNESEPTSPENDRTYTSNN